MGEEVSVHVSEGVGEEVGVHVSVHVSEEVCVRLLLADTPIVSLPSCALTFVPPFLANPCLVLKRASL